MLRINNVLHFKLMLHKHNECLLALHMAQRMELSVTPAGDLRLCKARGVSINEVKIGNEPGMQVGQWGEADSVADGVRSNVTLDSDSCRSNFLCMFLPLGSRPSALKKSGKSSRQSLKPKCCKRCPHQRFQLCGSALRTSLFSIFIAFYTPCL